MLNLMHFQTLMGKDDCLSSAKESGGDMNIVGNKKYGELFIGICEVVSNRIMFSFLSQIYRLLTIYISLKSKDIIPASFSTIKSKLSKGSSISLRILYR